MAWVQGDTGWWRFRRDELLALAGQRSPLYVFNDEALNECFFDLLSIEVIDRLLYPVHVNPHPKILRKAVEQGLGFWCNSFHEVDGLCRDFPRLDPERIAFFPLAADPEEVAAALDRGVYVGLDDPEPIRPCHQACRQQRVFLPWDKAHSLAGIASMGMSVEGLYGEPMPYARGPANGHQPPEALGRSLDAFPKVSSLILGGVREKALMDIPALSKHLQAVSHAYPEMKLWLIIPDGMISRTGGLILRVAGKDERAGIRRIRVQGDVQPLFSGNGRDVSHELVSLTRPDTGRMPVPTRITGHADGEGAWIVLPDAPALIETDDALMLTDMGAPGTAGFSNRARPDSIPQHYLHARSMCRVRI